MAACILLSFRVLSLNYGTSSRAHLCVWLHLNIWDKIYYKGAHEHNGAGHNSQEQQE